MKTETRMCVWACVCVLVLAMQTWAWEFNTDGYREGWTRARCTIDVSDGYLLVNVNAGTANLHVISPPGPYDGNEITGLYAKMLASQDVSGLAGEKVRFFVEQGGTNKTFELAGDPNQPEVVYVGLASNANWNGQQIDVFGLYLPHNAPEDYQVKVDWIRLEGLYLDNESFEYWDEVNDTILGWSTDPNSGYRFDEQENVNTREWAVAVTGTGQGQSLSQDIKGGLDMAKGEQIFLTAAFKVPTGSWDENAQIVLKVGEKGPDGWNDDPVPVAVDTFDEFFEASTVYTLQNEPDKREALIAQLTIRSPEGSVIYIDDIFVDVLPEPVDPNLDIQYGWPINCVKLAEGQEITIDGMVTPEEYAGAQAVVFNADTANSADPYDPNLIHEANFQFQQPYQSMTSLEDFSATYYIMWDDEYLYVALSCQDDSYAWSGDLPNQADCLQFTLGQTPDDRYVPNHYIPTVAPRDSNGNPSACNVFQPGTNKWYEYDLFQDPVVLYSGHVDDETQDWSVELKIPWIAMIGDFQGDLVNGDSDGDGKNVFPPDLLDEVGFTIQPRDWDYVGDTPTLGLSATNHGGTFPWAPLPDDHVQQRLIFVGPAE